MRSSESSEVPIAVKVSGRSRYVQYSRLGVGSRSCAGREKRTEAMSLTPMNLERGD
jgi:hypothetical protein